MPIYEYECPLCGHFEVVQKVDAKSVKFKPDCDNKNCPKTAKRVMSASAFHLKGSGWYKTDYAGTKAKGPKSKDAPSTDSVAKEPATTATGATDSSSSSTTTEAKSDDSSKKETKPKGGCGPGCGCH